MARYSDTVVDQFGNPVSGAQISVYPRSTPDVLAALTTDAAAALGNPVATDADGLFSFNAAADDYILSFKLASSTRPFHAETISLNDNDRVSVRDAPFLALGNDSADDYAAIAAAKAVAVASGRALVIPEGTYRHSDTLALAGANLHVIFEGKVTLKHTGTGKAVTLDGGASGFVYGLEFGVGNQPTLQGNINTTDLLYVRSVHHSRISARLRDCTTGCRVEFAVLTDFDLDASGNEGAFSVKTPTNMLVVDRRGAAEATTDCRFHVVAEGAASLGVDVVYAQGCKFTGTSESNAIGGLRVQVGSIKNTFEGFFCEQNGTGKHLDLVGSYNAFINCSFGGSTNTGLNTVDVSGTRNHFIGGFYHNVTESGYLNSWSLCGLSGTLNMSTNSYRTGCHDVLGNELIDTYPTAGIKTPTLVNSWVAGTSGAPRAPAYRVISGVVHLMGGVKSGTVASVIYTLPAGYRPGGTVWRKVYNPADGTDVVVAIAANGQVQHISGTVTAVPLDGISFSAEG